MNSPFSFTSFAFILSCKNNSTETLLCNFAHLNGAVGQGVDRGWDGPVQAAYYPGSHRAR